MASGNIYSVTMEIIAIHSFPFTLTSVTLNNIVPASLSFPLGRTRSEW
ncbi:hypothetical protein ACFQZT_08705 [Paenibacillus sp. GCM10027628]